MIRSSFIAGLCLLILGSDLFAQNVRYELGQRLRLLEQELAGPGRMDQRKRALEPLVQATPTFFRGQLADAAGLLDRARLLLVYKGKPSDAALWANSLYCKPATRFLDAAATELSVRIESFYRVKAERPQKVEVRLSLVGPRGMIFPGRTFSLKELPHSDRLPLKKPPQGDHLLRCEIRVADKTEAVTEQTLSVATNLAERLRQLHQGLKQIEAKPASTEKATFAQLIQTLDSLHDKQTLETNFPAAGLLKQAEELLQAIQARKPYYTAERSGQFWLTLAGEKSTDSVRLQVPPQAKKGHPLPLVVAMHGAGGSENMFFDGYGDGLVAKLCEKRGWLLVTTRSPLFAFGGGPNVPRVVDALKKVYPIDTKKVFLVGHSMGAAQAVAAVGQNPERFAAVAALGGGGGYKMSEPLKSVPFYVGVGDKDIGRSGGENLHRSLVKNGVKKVVFKKYADMEHLVVVQYALPEVFAFFEEAMK